MRLETVGVVGSGVMGSGVAQALAQASLRVVLVDVAPDQLRRAEASIERNLRLHRLFGGGCASRDRRTVTSLIRFTVDDAELGDVDVVIENVTENWAIKRSLYERIDRICRPDAVFAVNTSAIPITKIASVTGRADRVVGMHFMNPAPLMPVVEVVRAVHTSDETIDVASGLARRMGKQAIVVNDSPGFVTNRVMMLMINEAVFLVQEQVASIEDVDRLFKTCFGHKMGPLETADLIGVDTILYSIEVIHENFNDSKYRPCTLLRKMVDAGLTGRKSGRGFYQYGEDSTDERSVACL